MFFFSRRKREERRGAYAARDVPCETREFRLSGARYQGLTFYADCTSPASYTLVRDCTARAVRAGVARLCSLRRRDFRSVNDHQRGSLREPGDSFARVYTRHTRRLVFSHACRHAATFSSHARSRERGTDTRRRVKCHAIDSSESAIAASVLAPAARWRGARARPKDGRRTGT